MKKEPLFKSIMDVIDYRIDQDPMILKLKLSVNESISFMAMLVHLYKEGRVRYTDKGYFYRGVLIEITEVALME